MADTLIERIDIEIRKRSLLHHQFYEMWSEGRLNVDHLVGYSKEYFQLVKAVPDLVKNIGLHRLEASDENQIARNLKEENEHVELWMRFGSALGVTRDELSGYNGTAKTNLAVSKLKYLTTSSLEEAVAAMYAYEAELPKISRSKIDGLKKFYGLDNSDAVDYFEVHEKVDVEHAAVWRDMLRKISRDREDVAFEAAVKSLELQNTLLDSVMETYVGRADRS